MRALASQTVSGFLLHARPIKESETLCTLFTEQYGRIQCQLKTSPPELFREFQIKLKTKDHFHFAQNFRYLNAPLVSEAKASFYGLYLNELLYLLAPTPLQDAQFYGVYLSTLLQLNHQQQVQKHLRFFEMNLLKTLGSALDFLFDAQQHDILPTKRYQFQANKGFILAHNGRFPGHLILAAGQLDDQQNGALAVARECMAAQIDALLAGQKLQARQWPLIGR